MLLREVVAVKRLAIGALGYAAVLWLGIVGLVAFAPHLPSAISAAMGHGTPGIFVAQEESSCNYRIGQCSWAGSFTTPAGLVTKPHVELVGSAPGVQAGTRVRAVDTGDSSYVFVADQPWVWAPFAATVAFSLAVIVLPPVLLLARVMRKRRARPTASQVGQR